jgi:hypothetical protein
MTIIYYSDKKTISPGNSICFGFFCNQYRYQDDLTNIQTYNSVSAYIASTALGTPDTKMYSPAFNEITVISFTEIGLYKGK